MCCFTRPIDSVRATNIFARSGAAGRQFIVYGMSIRAREELAMVLPIPVPPGSGDHAVEFINLQEYPEFFAELWKGFPSGGGLSIACSAPAGATPPPLPVVQVGQFEASFVPTPADFARLDERFRLPSGAWDKLPQYRAHGFAVFKLKAGAMTVHPMAFSFPRAHPDQLFFPTIHIHDGQVHEHAFFDHMLYCQRAPGDRFALTAWRESSSLARRFVRVEKTRGIILGDQHVHRRVLRGTLKNQDFVLPA